MVMPFISQTHSGRIGARKSTSRYTDHFIRENVSSEIMHGVLSALKARKCRLVIHHNNSAEEEADILANLSHENLDGAVVMPEAYEDNMALYSSLGKADPPVVFVDRYIADAPVDYVVTDNQESTKEAVLSLIAKGHRRIAYFTDFSDITAIIDREEGYLEALNEAGIPVDEDIICGPQNVRNHQWSFLFALEHCIRLADPVTAVFGITDDVVWATLQAAKKLGLRVPEDLEVAGFFDAPVPVGVETPFLRVVQPKFRIGEIAAQILLDRMDGNVPAEPRQIRLPADLILT